MSLGIRYPTIPIISAQFRTKLDDGYDITRGRDNGVVMTLFTTDKFRRETINLTAGVFLDLYDDALIDEWDSPINLETFPSPNVFEYVFRTLFEKYIVRSKIIIKRIEEMCYGC